ncbi:MAG: hypothetical protein L3V56_11635, partial [Candidatus Magnetoovum sp. WYHC-5]|nr:hypothetical protein [Candidatus Magnetoovum sp. WYHC-5]
GIQKLYLKSYSSSNTTNTTNATVTKFNVNITNKRIVITGNIPNYDGSNAIEDPHVKIQIYLTTYPAKTTVQAVTKEQKLRYVSE